jgi:hypothetical protein
MADEIRELLREPAGKGRLTFNVLRLFEVNPPIEINDTPIAIKPRNDLPDNVERYGVLNATELTKIVAGTLTWDTDGVKQRSKNESEDKVFKRIRARYAATAATLVPEARVRYADFGKKHDAQGD